MSRNCVVFPLIETFMGIGIFVYPIYFCLQSDINVFFGNLGASGNYAGRKRKEAGSNV